VLTEDATHAFLDKTRRAARPQEQPWPAAMPQSDL